MHPKRRKLLIVDDEIDACRPAQNFFKKRDFEVVTTANGSDALMLISTFMPDLVLLDLTLEYSMSGVDVLRELRELDKDTKVIIVSANDDKKMKEELYGIGIQGFCHKPYLLEDLEKTVYETLGLEFNTKKVDVGENKENLEGANLIPGSSHELGNKLGLIKEACEELLNDEEDGFLKKVSPEDKLQKSIKVIKESQDQMQSFLENYENSILKQRTVEELFKINLSSMRNLVGGVVNTMSVVKNKKEGEK